MWAIPFWQRLISNNTGRGNLPFKYEAFSNRVGAIWSIPYWSAEMRFLKTTMLGGLFILLPIMLLWIGLKEIGGLLEAMATPIADLFPKGVFDNLTAPGVIAVLLIIGASFILGLAAKSAWLSSIGHRIENSIL